MQQLPVPQTWLFRSGPRHHRREACLQPYCFAQRQLAKVMHIRTQNGKQYVLCAWRRRYVRLTPEELVRQTTLQLLVDEFGYPHNLIAVEVPIMVAGKPKRCDAIVYNLQMQPMMLIEFKAPTVQLAQAVFDQAAIYNRHLNVPLLMLCNGISSVMAEIHPTKYSYLTQIPTYSELKQKWR